MSLLTKMTCRISYECLNPQSSFGKSQINQESHVANCPDPNKIVLYLNHLCKILALGYVGVHNLKHQMKNVHNLKHQTMSLNVHTNSFQRKIARKIYLQLLCSILNFDHRICMILR